MRQTVSVQASQSQPCLTPLCLDVRGSWFSLFSVCFWRWLMHVVVLHQALEAQAVGPAVALNVTLQPMLSVGFSLAAAGNLTALTRSRRCRLFLTDTKQRACSLIHFINLETFRAGRTTCGQSWSFYFKFLHRCFSICFGASGLSVSPFVSLSFVFRWAETGTLQRICCSEMRSGCRRKFSLIYKSIRCQTQLLFS